MAQTPDKANIGTDTRHVFTIVHALGAIWKERGPLTTGIRMLRMQLRS